MTEETKQPDVPTIKEAKEAGITLQQLEFCYNFVILNYNGKKAAKESGYSVKTSEVQASQLLSKVKIQKKVNELIQRKFEASNAKQYIEMSLNTDVIGQCFDDKGTPLKINKIPLHVRKLLKKIKIRGKGKNQYIEFESYSKDKAVDMMCKVLGLYAKDAAEEDVLKKFGDFMTKIGEQEAKLKPGEDEENLK